ncbi:hypothetical protein EON65_05680 [archaeon]|nr:MAG: hypothetical protein EON65_05680 [archaeon]
MNHYEKHVSQESYEQHKQGFIPFLICSVDTRAFEDVRRLQQSDVIADVSCSHNEEFNGNPTQREQVNIKLADFITAHQALSANQDHWLLHSGLSLYLSQCCLYAADSAAIQVPYPELLQHLPSCLQGEVIDAVNVWMNLQESKSSCHYDANHNLLVMVQGHKTAFLIPPSLTYLVKPVSCIAEAHNHSNLSCLEIEQIVSQYSAETYVVSMGKGDALFIPEGWWHMVYSTPATYAVNIWYKSNLYPLISSYNKMLPYIIRSAVNAYVSEDVNRTVQMNLSVNGQSCEEDLMIIVGRAISQDCKEEELLTACYAPLISADLGRLQSKWIPFAQHVSTLSRECNYKNGLQYFL